MNYLKGYVFFSERFFCELFIEYLQNRGEEFLDPQHWAPGLFASEACDDIGPICDH